MAYLWGSAMCARGLEQFVRPYCDGGTPMLGLYGKDSACGTRLEAQPLPVVCHRPAWFYHMFGPWNYVGAANSDAMEIASSYRLGCSSRSVPQARFMDAGSNPLNITVEWPVGLCMDTSSAACADWDPARYLPVDAFGGSTFLGTSATGSDPY